MAQPDRSRLPVQVMFNLKPVIFALQEPCNPAENLAFINQSIQELENSEQSLCYVCEEKKQSSLSAEAETEPKKSKVLCSPCEAFQKFKSACSQFDCRNVKQSNIEEMYADIIFPYSTELFGLYLQGNVYARERKFTALTLTAERRLFFFESSLKGF